MRWRARHRRSAVTLLEIVLAVGLLISLTSMTYWFYSSALATRKGGVAEAHKLRLARVVLDQIATEIRQVSSVTGDYGTGLLGDKERIRIVSRQVPASDLSRVSFPITQKSEEYDLIYTEYKIARHPEIQDDDGWELPLGLARIERRIPRPEPVLQNTGEANSGDNGGTGADTSGGQGAQAGQDSAAGPQSQGGGGSFFEQLRADEDDELSGDANVGAPGLGPQIDWEELYAPEIRYLRFCYYDGHKWWDTWQISGDNPLPQLVMVTIGYEGHPPCGEGLGQNEANDTNDEFCECLTREPPDCKPLAPDQYSTVVRVPTADPLFRSRVSRETQAMVEEAAQPKEENQQKGAGQP